MNAKPFTRHFLHWKDRNNHGIFQHAFYITSFRWFCFCIFSAPKSEKPCFTYFKPVFYFCGEPVYLFLMIAVTFSGYLHGLWINRAKDGRYAKVLSPPFLVCTFAVFKYTDFAIKNINLFFKLNIPALKLALPIGISFYTFQILSYTIDVYRGNARVQKSFIDFSAYVSLFPQLIAGPIVRYTTVESELYIRTHSLKDVASGINRFIIGLSKRF